MPDVEAHITWSSARITRAAYARATCRCASYDQLMFETPHEAGPRRHDSTRASSPDQARLATMRRGKRMTLDERLDLFERLSRDAAWARGAKRVR